MFKAMRGKNYIRVEINLVKELKVAQEEVSLVP